MPLAKVHKINPHPGYTSPGWSQTFCGRVGRRDAHVPNEYVTVVNGRFEATEGKDGVTCKRCREGRWARTDGRTPTVSATQPGGSK
jgi:hypothetical protein